MLKKLTNQDGFTLIELIMVMIILGILAAVAIPRYSSTIDRAEEAAENAIIAQVEAGLEVYATEQLLWAVLVLTLHLDLISSRCLLLMATTHRVELL